MFEQLALLAAGYTAALLITMLITVALIGVFWTKSNAYHK